MSRIVRFKPAVTAASMAEKTWGARIQEMIDDGRIILDRVENGQRVYKLDRKRLGMPEYPVEKMDPLVPIPEHKEPEETQEPLEDLKVKPINMPKTLAASLKRMQQKKFKS